MGMNVPLRMSVAATWVRCMHTWVSATQRKRGPHPFQQGGGGSHGTGETMGVSCCNPGEAPCPRLWALHCPQRAKPRRAGRRPDLWGTVRETQDSGPSRLENGLGQPPRVLKLAPGGRRAQ